MQILVLMLPGCFGGDPTAITSPKPPPCAPETAILTKIVPILPQNLFAGVCIFSVGYTFLGVGQKFQNLLPLLCSTNRSNRSAVIALYTLYCNTKCVTDTLVTILSQYLL